MHEFLIRPAAPADVGAIAAIYGHAVLTGTATFEIEPPGHAEMARRLKDLLDNGYPYLAAESTGAVVGYAYAGPYHRRPGYRHTVEDSVYLSEDWRGRGIGGALLKRLVTDCETRGFRQMVAIIGDSDNAASVRLHETLGFGQVGTFRHVGHKFGRWLDVVLMQRALGPGETMPPIR
jgi:L-amino acid N-acyltransferase YncA